jgi:hypothetical protein
VKVVASRRAKHSRLLRRNSGPRFAVRRPVLAAGGDVQPSGSPMARRFRGFIAPQPLAVNAFEALRKPRALPLDFEAAPILPPSEPAAVPVETATADAPTVTTVTTPKQDRLASKPAALMVLASAESRPVTLPELPPVKPAARPVLAEAAPQLAPAPAAPVVQAVMTEAPPAPQPSRFSIHGLVLALCGALGAASALRFIVGA